MYKAILKALLTPWKYMKKLQDSYDFTTLLVVQEEIKDLPYYEVWKEFCKQENVISDEKWYNKVKKYEEKIIKVRG